jgi:hypothetical protein
MRPMWRCALAVVVFSGAVASRASAGPVTCINTGDGFEDAIFGPVLSCETETVHFSPSSTTGFFNFAGGDVVNDLSFDKVLHDFDLRMSAFFVSPDDPVLTDRIPDGFLPMTLVTGEGDVNGYFRVEDLTDDPSSGPPQQGVDYSGFWTQNILWFGDGNYVDPQVLHDPRPLDVFDHIITVPGSFDPGVTPCTECDPGIRGTGDDFSDTTVVNRTAVPEPASLVLFGTGALALTRRRRR